MVSEPEQSETPAHAASVEDDAERTAQAERAEEPTQGAEPSAPEQPQPPGRHAARAIGPDELPPVVPPSDNSAADDATATQAISRPQRSAGETQAINDQHLPASETQAISGDDVPVVTEENLYHNPYLDDAPPPNPGANPAASGPHAMPPNVGQPTAYAAYPPQGYQQQAPHADPNVQLTQPAMQPIAPPQHAQHAQQPLPPQHHQQPQARRQQPGDELSSAQLIKPVKRKPQSGWRKAVYIGTGHLVNPGESPADKLKRELIARVNQPLRGCYKIAMLSLKGGVGKTTTTTALGSTFASLRGDRVVAVDANPDRGTLSQKIPMETTATVRHLLRDADRITRYSDIRAYTSQGSSRLEILASEQDPAVSEAFSERDYRRAVDLLEHFYNIVLTDCGTGLMHSAMKGVLDQADALVVVSSGSVDGARSASATMDWLDAHGYGELVKRSVAVINSVRPKVGSVDLNKLEAHFGARTRAVCKIPFDGHLEEGAEIELDRLHEQTRLALLRLAAAVADGFAAFERG